MNTLLIALFMMIASGGNTPELSNISKYPVDTLHGIPPEGHIQGIWKIAEDTDMHNYLIIELDTPNGYCISYMNRGGDNRGIEHGPLFFSVINGVSFISIGAWDRHYTPGWVLMRVDNIGYNSWHITARVVTSPEIKNAKSSAELHDLLAKNLDNPAFYGKEVHFNKKFELNSCHG